MKPIVLFWILTILCGCHPTPRTKQSTAGIAPSCAATKTDDKEWYRLNQKAPKLPGLEGIDFPITSRQPEVQDYINQGLMLAYGFNHAEAARSFFQAARLDSTCAMAYWGFAYALGPNYNGGMEDDNYQRAYQAILAAQQHAHRASKREQILIAALAKRYTAEPPEDRSALDLAYATAMKKAYQQFPNDADIGALYAEALMILHPWDLYIKETKAPQAWTAEIVMLLEKLIQQHPQHAGAHHFYIHAIEASKEPEKALGSARVLDSLVKGAGHLLHMPSHIYINTGDYHLGTISNLNAIAADSIYTTACHAQGMYPLAYYPHNQHFLAATATLEGHAALAWQAANAVQQHTAKDLMNQPGWGTLQHYYSIPYYVGVKFNMYDSLINMPAPAQELIYPRALWHYARGMAFLGKNKLQNSQQELDKLMTLAADTSLQNLTIWDINTTADLVQIAKRVLQASLDMKQQRQQRAISLFKEAIAIEDQLNYNEPPDWFFSVRHYLGDALLNEKKFKEAEQVFQQDLQIWKNNIWALQGLHKALLAQHKTQEAKPIKLAMDKAGQFANFNIP
ncbi:hypothetical protein [Sphingobacterium humi]|uniref:Tetratricopeptide repeat protein n=1 Tax=Sphingobacterium humi TaxID=1796905 RepID=A0A6N8KV06_9SPHI|nr:hypothetical protein [Sphingobacterium humi]MVZ60549.1 hypothetical protein [Sphingobacterium humi]